MPTSGKVPLEKTLFEGQGLALPRMATDVEARWVETYIRRQVFPQAPSPTMTSLRRISAILIAHDTRVSRLDFGVSKDAWMGVEAATVSLGVMFGGGCRVVQGEGGGARMVG